MRITSRLIRGTAAAVLAVATLLPLAATGVAHAAAQTCTWTGTAGDNKFSTATNWSGCGGGTPQNGDSVVFDDTALTFTNYAATITNDTNPQLASLTFNITTSNSGEYLYLSQLTLASNGVISTPQYNGSNGYVTIGTPAPAGTSGTNPNLADLVVVGDYTLTSNLAPGFSFKNLNVSGKLTLNSSSVDPSGWFAYNPASVNVGSIETSIPIDFESSTTPVSVTFPLTLDTGTQLAFSPGMMSSATTWNVSSPLTISTTTPIQVSVGSGSTVNFTGTGADPNMLVKSNTSQGTLTVGSTTQTVQATTTTLNGGTASGSTSTNFAVGNKETATLGSSSSYVNGEVMNGGALVGEGTLTGNLTVDAGGWLSPGHSPGCITSDTLNLSGTYYVDLGGTMPCSGYDQMQVLDARNITGAVTIDATSAVLQTNRYNNYTPTKGQQFIIIDQSGTQPVVGTFKGLAEGATFSQNGVEFQITYKGGDGNDVVLTVMNSPATIKTPDTGFALAKAHPMVTLVATLVSAAALVLLARRIQAKRQ